MAKATQDVMTALALALDDASTVDDAQTILRAEIGKGISAAQYIEMMNAQRARFAGQNGQTSKAQGKADKKVTEKRADKPTLPITVTMKRGRTWQGKLGHGAEYVLADDKNMPFTTGFFNHRPVCSIALMDSQTAGRDTIKVSIS